MRAHQIAHVFYQAQDGNTDLLEHVDGLAGIFERDVGRRGDDHCARERRGLNESELDVAGAGREVDEEVIEFAPVDAAQELLDDAVEHRATPDQGLVAGVQESHRHYAHAVLFERLDAFANRVRRGANAHHERDVGAVDVGIEQANLVASTRERDGEVDRDGGFAYTAFTGSDRDQVLDARNRKLRLFSVRWIRPHQFDLRLSRRWHIGAKLNRGAHRRRNSRAKPWMKHFGSSFREWRTSAALRSRSERRSSRQRGKRAGAAAKPGKRWHRTGCGGKWPGEFGRDRTAAVE